MLDNVLVADDPLYEELYDVRKEAEAMGNAIDVGPIMASVHTMRAQSPVHKGKLREILGLPGHDRHVLAKGRQHWTALTYEACEAAFRDPATFSNAIQGHPNPTGEKSKCKGGRGHTVKPHRIASGKPSG